MESKIHPLLRFETSSAHSPHKTSIKFSRVDDEPWPDIPFHTENAEAVYSPQEFERIVAEIEEARSIMQLHCPAGAEFVDEHLSTVLLRRCEALPLFGSSNPTRPGTSLFVNLHTPEFPQEAIVEFLIHESTHQYLYSRETIRELISETTEIDVQSPWTLNRIPLSSLVQACFVWYAVAFALSRLAPSNKLNPERLGKILAKSVFGFHFLRPILHEKGTLISGSLREELSELTNEIIAATTMTARGACIREMLADPLHQVTSALTVRCSA